MLSQTSVVKNAPKVFMIGEYEQKFESLVSDHSQLLLNVCDNSMDEAYSKWMDLLVMIDDFAVENSIDIKGSKIWLNVFWNTEGEIDNIVFYPKPHSKNMDYKILTELFTKFIPTYQSDLRFAENFSHYGSASFPTYRSSNKASEN
jgi:hypothetical protein